MNRLREGIRVIEEAVRFSLNNEELSVKLKALRHRYGHMRMLVPDDVISERDTEQDIGKDNEYDITEQTDIADIAGRSFGRTEEAARVIEEYGRLINNEISRIAKEIRFELYELEKAVMPLLRKQNNIVDNMGLYLVMTNPVLGYEETARIAVKHNVKIIQLRDKAMNDSELLQTAQRIRAITQGTDTLFIVNDRPDIAMLSGADGVHVGQNDISVNDCRQLKTDMIVGKSTHNMQQLEAAMIEKPDYIGIGPLYPTQSKAVPDPVLGLDEAERMLKASTVPAVAIGGINAGNLSDVLSRGFANFGIVSYIVGDEDTESRIEEIMDIYRSYYDTEN